jgi:DNA invertase Pin-like site-specific DNA recombinase
MSAHVIYARKSTESDDRQVLSIDSQVQELKLLALRRGLEVQEVMSEARSAKAPGRPIFGSLMRRIAKGEIASILCWKMDRLARNHLDHGAVLQALADGKLERVITPEREYTADGNDRFLGNFEFGIATKFIDDLRANVRRGNRARFQLGWPNYRPPIGYLEDRSGPTTTVVKDPERFSIVRNMWDQLLTGSSPIEISRWAEDHGLRTRKTAHLGGKPRIRPRCTVRNAQQRLPAAPVKFRTAQIERQIELSALAGKVFVQLAADFAEAFRLLNPAHWIFFGNGATACRRSGSSRGAAAATEGDFDQAAVAHGKLQVADRRVVSGAEENFGCRCR